MTAFAPMFDPPFLICDAFCSVLRGLRGISIKVGSRACRLWRITAALEQTYT